jgi:hypothetical protein
MVTLTNVGTAYDSVANAKGLGIGLLNFTGITQLTFCVYYSKVGTGVLSWQLWNDTDGSQIGVITDSAAAGDNKVQQATFSVSLAGVKRIRVRAKSTVATDDPVFYGAAVLPVTA